MNEPNEAYDSVWVVADGGPNGEVLVGFELDEDRHFSGFLTREAAVKLALELLPLIPQDLYAQTGTDSPEIVCGAASDA